MICLRDRRFLRESRDVWRSEREGGGIRRVGIVELESEAITGAFRMFTEELSSWWPLATHSVCQDKAVRCAFEGRVGGEVYEEDTQGRRHVWGTVTVWDPPHRLA